MFIGQKKRKGFTLVEILITTLLVFLVFTLIYATFFSISSVTAQLEKKMKSSELVFKFLKQFGDEIKCMILEDKDDTSFFERKKLAFTTTDRAMPYPARITYFVEPSGNNGESLYRRQENLLDGYSFVQPALPDADSIDFLFFDGEYWDYAKEQEKITAVAVEVDYAGEKTFFPVKLYREKPDDEKK